MGPRRSVGWALLGLGLAGCGGTGEVLVPVTGKVTFKGEAAPGAFVVFHPVGGAAPAKGPDGAPGEVARPSGQVKGDGSFVLTTHDEGDGAPPGQYHVTVEWRKLVKRGDASEAGPNVVPKEYGTANTTPVKVTIEANAPAKVTAPKNAPVGLVLLP